MCFYIMYRWLISKDNGVITAHRYKTSYNDHHNPTSDSNSLIKSAIGLYDHVTFVSGRCVSINKTPVNWPIRAVEHAARNNFLLCHKPERKIRLRLGMRRYFQLLFLPQNSNGLRVERDFPHETRAFYMLIRQRLLLLKVCKLVKEIMRFNLLSNGHGKILYRVKLPN